MRLFTRKVITKRCESFMRVRDSITRKIALNRLTLLFYRSVISPLTSDFQVDSLDDRRRRSLIESLLALDIFLYVFFSYRVRLSHERTSLFTRIRNRFGELENISHGFKLLLIKGENCENHERLLGRCVELPQCSTLINLYRSNPSQDTINILIQNQRSCGNRKVGRNPLMCCSDGVQQTTRAPPRVPVTAAPSGSGCDTPDGIRGFCIGTSYCIVIIYKV